MAHLDTVYTASEQPHCHCGIMKLPTEMRIRIYDFALLHLLDAVYIETPSDTKLYRPIKKSRSDSSVVPFYTGALALIHTNRTIRAESLDVLASLMLAYVGRLAAEADRVAGSLAMRVTDALRDRLGFEDLQAVARAVLEEEKEIHKLGNCAIQVHYISWTMGWTKGG